MGTSYAQLCLFVLQVLGSLAVCDGQFALLHSRRELRGKFQCASGVNEDHSGLFEGYRGINHEALEGKGKLS